MNSACLSSRTIINIITRASAETGVEMLTAPAAARGRRAWASVGRPRRARDREREQREIAFVLPCALAGGPGALSKCSYRQICLAFEGGASKTHISSVQCVSQAIPLASSLPVPRMDAASMRENRDARNRNAVY
jgi:hypothetical protein